MTGYLEDYVSTTAKVSRANSKDYEKVLKVSVSGTRVAPESTNR